MKQVTYHIVPLSSSNLLVFRQAGIQGQHHLLTLLYCADSNKDVLDFIGKNMVACQVPGEIVIEEFPVDFLMKQLTGASVDFRP